MSLRAFVTGGSGFVGMNLLHQLVEQGWEVTALVRRSSPLEDIRDLPITLVEGDITAQTRQVMENIKSVLAEAGCTLDDVVKCSVWLDDPRDFGIFNRVFAEYFGDDAPTRSTVRSELMIDAKIEIDAIAYKPVG